MELHVMCPFLVTVTCLMLEYVVCGATSKDVDWRSPHQRVRSAGLSGDSPEYEEDSGDSQDLDRERTKSVRRNLIAALCGAGTPRCAPQSSTNPKSAMSGRRCRLCRLSCPPCDCQDEEEDTEKSQRNLKGRKTGAESSLGKQTVKVGSSKPAADTQGNGKKFKQKNVSKRPEGTLQNEKNDDDEQDRLNSEVKNTEHKKSTVQKKEENSNIKGDDKAKKNNQDKDDSDEGETVDMEAEFNDYQKQLAEREDEPSTTETENPLVSVYAQLFDESRFPDAWIADHSTRKGTTNGELDEE